MANILIVDDDEFVLEYLTGALSEQHSIETAATGLKALEILTDFSAELIVMDIQMPDMNGYETASIIRQSDNKLPILFLSRLSSLDERLKAYDAGGSDFISKPADPEELTKKINILLASTEHQIHQDADEIAIKALSDLSYLGQIISFLRNSCRCRNMPHLANEIFTLTKLFGLRCSLVIRDNDPVCFFDDEITKNIDSALLESLNGAQKIMEFGNHRAAFNWQHASLLVKNMPKDTEAAGAMRDYLAYMMDGIEQCVRKIIVESTLRRTVQQFSDQNDDIKRSIFAVVDDLEIQLEQLFNSLDINDEISSSTESRLISLINTAKNKAANKLQSGEAIEQRLNQLLSLMEQSEEDPPKPDCELF